MKSSHKVDAAALGLTAGSLAGWPPQMKGGFLSDSSRAAQQYFRDWQGKVVVSVTQVPDVEGWAGSKLGFY